MNGDGTVWADLGVVLLFTKIRVVVWGLLLWLAASNVCSCCLDMCTSFIYLGMCNLENTSGWCVGMMTYFRNIVLWVDCNLSVCVCV